MGEGMRHPSIMESCLSLPAFQVTMFNRHVAAFYKAAMMRGPLEAAREVLSALIGGEMHLAFATRNDGEVAFPAMKGDRDFLTATMGAAASHPLIYKTGGAVMAISDVLSRQQWRRRAMYHTALPFLKMEDALGTDLPLDGDAVLSVCVIRSRRGYTDKERLFFSLLLDHFRTTWCLYGRNRSGEGTLRILGLDELPAGPVALQMHVAGCLDAARVHPSGPAEHRLVRRLANTIQEIRAGGQRRNHPAASTLHRLEGGQGLVVALLPPSLDHPGTLVIRQDQVKDPMMKLTPREKEVGRWLCEGKTNEEIAIILGIRPGTVKRHVENLYAKLEVPNRTAAAQVLMQG